MPYKFSAKDIPKSATKTNESKAMAFAKKKIVNDDSKPKDNKNLTFLLSLQPFVVLNRVAEATEIDG